MTYNIAVPAGICTAETLHSEGFVETYFNDAGKRRFAIFINNDISEKDVDVFDLVGKNSALELHFRSSPNPFGFIKIQLKKRVKNPMLSGIMISSAT